MLTIYLHASGYGLTECTTEKIENKETTVRTKLVDYGEFFRRCQYYTDAYGKPKTLYAEDIVTFKWETKE